MPGGAAIVSRKRLSMLNYESILSIGACQFHEKRELGVKPNSL
jgi:hypothetical protein